MEGQPPEQLHPINHENDDYLLPPEFAEELRSIHDTETLEQMFDQSLSVEQRIVKEADEIGSLYNLLSPMQKAMYIEITWRRTQI